MLLIAALLLKAYLFLLASLHTSLRLLVLLLAALAGQDETGGGLGGIGKNRQRPWRDRTKQAAALAEQDKTGGSPGGTGQNRRRGAAALVGQDSLNRHNKEDISKYCLFEGTVS